MEAAELVYIRVFAGLFLLFVSSMTALEWFITVVYLFFPGPFFYRFCFRCVVCLLAASSCFICLCFFGALVCSFVWSCVCVCVCVCAFSTT